LLTVHAHPDDESSKGPATVAKYHAEGARTVLVCCTGGEEGDILNPAADTPEVRANLPSVRRRELYEAATVIGYDEVVWLGYRDSGMPGAASNSRSGSFAMAPLEEAVGRMVGVLRRERPQVVVTYGEDQSTYPHPDHLRAHEVTCAAFGAASDPVAYPDQGPPWRPSKLYYTIWSGRMILALHQRFAEIGLESPFGGEWLERAVGSGVEPDAVIDISPWAHVRRDALLCHRTQVDPASPIWSGLTGEMARTVHPLDEYLLARSDVEVEQPEDDLFAGVR
jgi:mycothiol S-conjugate amidase